MNKKICIVVDHPDRDLNGYIYLITKLNLAEVTYYLVPYYNFREIYIIKPDILILNHSRWIYSNFLKILKKLNVSTFILDTEGGMVNNSLIKEYISFSQISRNIRYIDGYFIWSEKIKKEILKKKKNLNTKKLIVTGNPRFEYMRSKKNFKSSSTILFNLNFATVNPKFSTVKQEINLLKKQGKSNTYLKNYVNHQKKMQEKFIALIDYFQNKKNKTKIVVRPHPYESKKIYEKIFKKGNVEINHSRNLIDEISKSFVVIQNNCATAIDAVLLSRPSIFYQPFKSKYLDQKLISKISLICNSRDKVLSNVISYKNKKKNENIKSLKMINREYSRLKGGLDVIEKTFKEHFNKEVSNVNLFKLLFKYQEFSYAIKSITKVLIGRKITNYFRSQFSKKSVSIEILENFIKKDPKFKKFFKKKRISYLKKFQKNFYTIKIN